MRFALATSSPRLVTLCTTIPTHEFPDPGASPGIRREVIHSPGGALRGEVLAEQRRGVRENKARSKAESIYLARRNHQAGRIRLPAEPFRPSTMRRPCADDRQCAIGASLLLPERTREVEGSNERGKMPFIIPISRNDAPNFRMYDWHRFIS
jgi:hypothetical protein